MKNTALLIIDMINDFQFSHGPILAKKMRNDNQSYFTIKENNEILRLPRHLY